MAGSVSAGDVRPDGPDHRFRVAARARSPYDPGTELADLAVTDPRRAYFNSVGWNCTKRSRSVHYDETDL
jgi:hypothetical protein